METKSKKTKSTAVSGGTKKTNNNKSKREVYIDKLAKQMKKWDRELEELERAGEKRIADIKSRLSKQVEHIKARRKELKEKRSRVEEAGDEAFKEIRQDMEKLWKDIQKGFASTRKELKK